MKKKNRKLDVTIRDKKSELDFEPRDTTSVYKYHASWFFVRNRDFLRSVGMSVSNVSTINSLHYSLYLQTHFLHVGM